MRRLVLGVALFALGSIWAYVERGYYALGGEVLLALVPYVVPLLRDLWRDEGQRTR